MHDIVIIGAGPSGLATAIASKQHGLDYLLLEKGVLVNAIFHFPTNMVFFTTPELLEIGGLPLVTPFEKPTRLEALRYYRRVVDTYRLDIRFGQTVTGVTSLSDGRFAIETTSKDAASTLFHGRAVVFAIGYYDHPNVIGIPGEDLPKVSHYYTEPHPFYRKEVAVVGGGNSAAEAALDLYRAGARVTLIHRRDQLKDTIKYWVRPDIENRIAERSIRARFGTSLKQVLPDSIVVEQGGREEKLANDFVFLLTGYHPDTELLSRAGVAVDPESLVPVHDAGTHETNVPGVFLAGGVVAGRQRSNNIFIENGRLHGEEIVALVAKRLGSEALTSTEKLDGR